MRDTGYQAPWLATAVRFGWIAPDNPGHASARRGRLHWAEIPSANFGVARTPRPVKVKKVQTKVVDLPCNLFELLEEIDSPSVGLPAENKVNPQGKLRIGFRNGRNFSTRKPKVEHVTHPLRFVVVQHDRSPLRGSRVDSFIFRTHRTRDWIPPSLLRRQRQAARLHSNLESNAELIGLFPDLAESYFTPQEWLELEIKEAIESPMLPVRSGGFCWYKLARHLTRRPVSELVLRNDFTAHDLLQMINDYLADFPGFEPDGYGDMYTCMIGDGQGDLHIEEVTLAHRQRDDDFSLLELRDHLMGLDRMHGADDSRSPLDSILVGSNAMERDRKYTEIVKDHLADIASAVDLELPARLAAEGIGKAAYKFVENRVHHEHHHIVVPLPQPAPPLEPPYDMPQIPGENPFPALPGPPVDDIPPIVPEWPEFPDPHLPDFPSHYPSIDPPIVGMPDIIDDIPIDTGVIPAPSPDVEPMAMLQSLIDVAQEHAGQLPPIPIAPGLPGYIELESAFTLLQNVGLTCIDVVRDLAHGIAVPLPFIMPALKLAQYYCQDNDQAHGSDRIYRGSKTKHFVHGPRDLQVLAVRNALNNVQGPGKGAVVWLDPFYNEARKHLSAFGGNDMLQTMLDQEVQNDFMQTINARRALPPLKVDVNAGPERIEMLAHAFRGFRIEPSNIEHPHPIAQAVRNGLHATIVGEIQRQGINTVHLVGASAPQVASTPNVVHNCAPEITGRDRYRHNHAYPPALKAELDAVRCKDLYQNCKTCSGADLVYAPYSAQDIGVTEFCQAMIEQRQRCAWVLINLPIPFLDKRVTTYTDALNGFRYERENGKIRMYFTDAASAGYVNDEDKLLSWCRPTPLFDGWSIQIEEMKRVGSTYWLELRIVEGAQESIPTMFNTAAEEYILLPLLRPAWRKSDGCRGDFVVPARRFRALVAFISTLEGSDLRFKPVANKLRGQLAEVKIGKTVVENRMDLSTPEFFAFVGHALLCHLMNKLDYERVMPDLEAEIHAEYERHSRNFFSRYQRYLRDLFSFSLSVKREFHDPKFIDKTFDLLFGARLDSSQMEDPYQSSRYFRLINDAAVERPVLIADAKMVALYAAKGSCKLLSVTERLTRKIADSVRRPQVFQQPARPDPANRVAQPTATTRAGPSSHIESPPIPTAIIEDVFVPTVDPAMVPLPAGPHDDETCERCNAAYRVAHEDLPGGVACDFNCPTCHKQLCPKPPNSDIDEDSFYEAFDPSPPVVDEQSYVIPERGAPVPPPEDLQSAVELAGPSPAVHYENERPILEETVERYEAATDVSDDAERDYSIILANEQGRAIVPMVVNPSDIDQKRYTSEPFDPKGLLDWNAFAPGKRPAEVFAPEKFWFTVPDKGGCELLKLALERSRNFILDNPHRVRLVDGKAYVDKGEEAEIKKLQEEFFAQEAARSEDIHRPNILITGVPGAGKTAIASALGDSYKCLVVVPTKKLRDDWKKRSKCSVVTQHKVIIAKYDVMIIDEVFAMHPTVVCAWLGIARKHAKKVVCLGDPYQRSENSLATKSPLFGRVLHLPVSNTMPLDACTAFLNVNKNMMTQQEYRSVRTRNSLLHSIYLYPALVGVKPRQHDLLMCTTKKFNNEGTTGDTWLSIAQLQGSRTESVILELPPQRLRQSSWIKQNDGIRTVMLTRHSERLHIVGGLIAPAPLTSFANWKPLSRVDGLQTFALAARRRFPGELDRLLSFHDIESERFASLQAGMPLQYSRTFMEASYTANRDFEFKIPETAAKVGDVSLDEIQAFIYKHTNFDSFKDHEHAIDFSGPTSHALKSAGEIDGIQRTTNVRGFFDDADKLAEIQVSSSRFEDLRNMLLRQVATSKRFAEACDVSVDAALIFKRFLECYAKENFETTCDYEDYAAHWLAKRTPAFRRKIADTAFGEDSTSLRFTSFLKSQTKAKPTPGYAAEQNYGQLIIANGAEYACLAGPIAARVYEAFQEMIREDVIPDYGLSDAELSKILDDRGMLRYFADGDDIQMDVSRQDSSHSPEIVLAFCMLMEYLGIDPEFCELYFRMRSLYFVKSLSPHLYSAEISFNLPSGDPFTLIANIFQMLCVVACRYKGVEKAAIMQKGDDLEAKPILKDLHPLSRLPAISSVTVKVELNRAPYHAGRFITHSGLIVDPVRVFMKHFTRLSSNETPTVELYRSLVSRNVYYSEEQLAFLVPAVLDLYPALDGEDIDLIIRTVARLRNWTFFKMTSDFRKDEEKIFHTTTDCAHSVAKRLFPKLKPSQLRAFRDLSLPQLSREFAKHNVAINLHKDILATGPLSAGVHADEKHVILVL